MCTVNGATCDIKRLCSPPLALHLASPNRRMPCKPIVCHTLLHHRVAVTTQHSVLSRHVHTAMCASIPA